MGKEGLCYQIQATQQRQSKIGSPVRHKIMENPGAAGVYFDE